MKFFAFFIIALSYISPLFASQWRLQLDNDIVLGQDGGYTSGFAINWLSRSTDINLVPKNAFWQTRLFWPQADNQAYWGVSVQQGMWTPKEISYDFPQADDRPYAGVLMLSQHSALYSEGFAQKNWLSLGLIGPSSGAEALQRQVHKWTGSTPPKGWDYQIENSAIVQYTYEADALLYRGEQASSWDVSGFVYVDVGNLRSDIVTGFTLRYGADLATSFGRISHHSGYLPATVSKSRWQWQMFSQLHLGYRVNDLTIEGDLPYTSNVVFESLRMGAKAGAWWQYERWRLDFTINLEHRDFKTDDEQWNGYGSLGIAWLY